MGKPSMLDRILGASKKKVESQTKQTEEQVRSKLKGILYEDELVEELLPTFLALQGSEGFSKVIELLETKERQIEAISGGEWFKKESVKDETTIDTEEEEEDESENLVDKILNEKYKG